jgi:hypothetical protein
VLLADPHAPPTAPPAPQQPRDPSCRAEGPGQKSDQEEAARRLPWLVAGLAGAWLACEAAALLGLSHSPARLAFVNLIILPHFPIALAGMLAFFFCIHPTRREIHLLVAATVALATGFKLLDFVGGWETPVTYCACAGLGLASLALLVLRVCTSSGATRRQAAGVLMTAILVLGAIPLIFFFLLVTIPLHPTTLDALAYAADGTLGTQVTFVLGRWFSSVPALAMTSGVAYVTLPLAFMVVVVLHLRASGPPVLEVLPTFLTVAIVGFTIYNFFPLVGPLYAFEGVYPHSEPAVAAVLASPLSVPDVPRNCMPSLHTAWALVIWWQARPLGRWVRVLACVYLVFTVLATVGYGAHYVFDVVVAAPSTMACQVLCMRVPERARRFRRWALVGSASLTVAWLGLLRWGLPALAFSPLLTAPAALLTVVGCLWVEHRLYRAAHDPELVGEEGISPVAWTLAADRAQ